MAASVELFPDWQPLLDALAEQGWVVAPNLLDRTLVTALRQRLHLLKQQASLQSARIGSGGDASHSPQIRSDQTCWLEGTDPAEMAFFQLMASLQQAVNRDLMLGLRSYEAHFAHYQPSAFYKTHLDAFRGGRGRVLSSVAYLNDQWPADGGGELKLYRADHTPVATVLPQGGTLALFLSEEIPHEVLPARLDRYSIAGWFRVGGELPAASIHGLGLR